jgi:membrane-anchored glycerophosphoryl diester phosphodiesterase (GDPDase)
MVLVGLMRHALGLKKTTTFIYFSLGAPVWRMLGAVVLGIVVYIVAAIVICVLGALAAKFAAPMIPQAYHGYAVAGGIGLCVVFGLFLFYAAFRLFFFLPAVVVAEERIGLGRSWSLGGGNFWRMFIVYLLVTLPVGFIFGVALEMTILPTIVAEATKLHGKPETKDVLIFLQHLAPLLPAVITIFVIYAIAVRGLLVGAIANAYKGVTEVPKSATPAAAAAPPPAEPVVPPEVAPLVPDAPKESATPAEAAPKEATDGAPPATSETDTPPTESAPKITDAPN